MRVVSVRVVQRAMAAKATKTLLEVLVRVGSGDGGNLHYIFCVEIVDAD